MAMMLAPMQAAAFSRQVSGEAQPETHLFDKTRLCKFYQKGKCRRGPRCTFAHSETELRTQPDFFKTQLCVDHFRGGLCSRGAACRYAHSPEEIRRTNVPKKARVQTTHQDMAMRAAPVPMPPRQKEDKAAVVQAQLAALQAELQALQTRAGHVEAQVPESAPGDIVTDCDFAACASGWSRQSTAEPAGAFGEELSEDGDESWCGDLDGMHLLAEAEDGRHSEEEMAAAADDEEELACELLVKNTFFCLTPTELSSETHHRRVRSAPPGRRGSA
eukprot:CAMPEP_0176044476 /NCGR_PEP_ID=MMETSP0120_2-20121206/22074_1 /TAXON_ID=160619 /ORGANISM="Kryptoperidinium foliaceum, Strain CCMP 1326" /LENGTH=273 /DNA_ID=CAMNT_0017377881 /DNA_START=60 /DNA_END=881 /DNA_ORIENTATION=+